MMIGHSTTKASKSGKVYNYYTCKNSGGSKPCKKKKVDKDTIEDIVVDECRVPHKPRDRNPLRLRGFSHFLARWLRNAFHSPNYKKLA